MFRRESDMVAAATAWMRGSGLHVKSEFVTPWGICDLVGLSFNANKVAERLRRRQTRPVSSITRAALLLRIPDVAEQRSVTLARLVRQCAPAVPSEVVSAEIDRLIADRFVVRGRRGGLQKQNGWVPLHDRLVAIELKMSRVEEAMRQARNNLGFADESYIALPADVARGVVAKAARYAQFFEAGVGLLAVTHRRCEVVVPARTTGTWKDAVIQFCCVEKFWRTRIRGS